MNSTIPITNKQDITHVFHINVKLKNFTSYLTTFRHLHLSEILTPGSLIKKKYINIFKKGKRADRLDGSNSKQ